ncbi:MAG TPA: choice-of-anchor Q domain-containing protein [Planctomycetota bacterium]
MLALATIPILPLLALAPLAETYTVHPTPGVADFLSPAAALASPLVGDGDRIEVLPGTYAAPLLVDKAVRLVAVAGPAFTVLDAAGGGTVLTITAGATVRGFTITGCGEFVTVGGVAITSVAPVRLAENVIVDNHPVGDVGIPVGGVWVAAGATARLRDNEIRGNTSLSVGGFFAGPTSSFELFRDRIHGNGGAPTITGGALLGGSGRFVDVQVTGNHGSGIGGIFWAGGMPFPDGATLELLSCTIHGNVAGSPVGSVGGLYFDDGGIVTVRNTLIHSNLGSAGSDLLFSSDFSSPPVLGILDVDYSMIGMPTGGYVPGPHMLPPFAAPGLVAPVSATPFGPTAGGDFRPAAGSLLLDAGLGSAFPPELPPTDALGLTRFFGAETDVGAFERQPAHIRRR